jgi:hypothetical protein
MVELVYAAQKPVGVAAFAGLIGVSATDNGLASVKVVADDAVHTNVPLLLALARKPVTTKKYPA